MKNITYTCVVMSTVMAGFAQAGENESKKAASGQGLFQEAPQAKCPDQAPMPVAAESQSKRAKPALAVAGKKQVSAHAETPAPEKNETENKGSAGAIIGLGVAGIMLFIALFTLMP